MSFRKVLISLLVLYSTLSLTSLESILDENSNLSYRNDPPIADAGEDETISSNESYHQLDGTGSYDPDGDELTYYWTGPLPLDDPTSPSPTFQLPLNRSLLQNASESRDLTGTYLECNTYEYIPGDVVEWEFSLHNLSQDNEWITDLDIDFPQGVFVTDATDLVGGSGGAMEFSNEVGEGANVNWHGENILGYGYLHGGQTATASVSITLSGNLPHSFIITYFVTGDGYGDEPHIIFGQLEFTNSQIVQYEFILVVDDGINRVTSEPDTVVITVEEMNQIPIANAGLDVEVNEGDVCSLDGTNSYDPDGDVIYFNWIAPAGINLSDESSPSPTFLAPEVSEDTIYEIVLIVNDGYYGDESIPDTVEITVIEVPENHAPIAEAGETQIVYEGDFVTLDGSSSYDPDGNPITFLWIAPNGIELDDPNSPTPSFTALMIPNNVPVEYIFTLVVDDNIYRLSDTDDVSIIVMNINQQPIADAGEDDIIFESNSTYQLDGSGSIDFDNDSLMYIWTCELELSNPTSITPEFDVPDVQENTFFDFVLVVDDGFGRIQSEPDTVVIFVLWDGVDITDDIIAQTELISNTPNPFNPITTINFQISEVGYVDLSIYNIKGQKIKTLVSSNQDIGSHEVIWDGKNYSGNSVGSGIYYYKLISGNYRSIKKMVLLK